MEIQELVLKHYGKFENHRIALKPGINIIYGGNETGKSTIHSFIRAMFFGLNRGRGRAARTDEYQIRQPWDTPGAFLGSMRLVENGEVYRIDRCFDRSAPPLAVTREDGTRPIVYDRPQQVMDVLLGGVSETAFVNTVFIAQAQAETDEGLARALRQYMVNSENAMDMQLDLSAALQSLRKRKKQFEQQKKNEEEQMETRIEQKQAQAETIRRELELLRRQAGPQVSELQGGRGESRDGGGRQQEGRRESRDGIGGQQEGRRKGRDGIGRQQDGRGRRDGGTQEDGLSPQKTGRVKWLLIGLLLLAGVFALACAVFLTDIKLRVFLGVFGAIFLALTIPVHFLFKGVYGDDAEADGEYRYERDKYLVEEIRSREEYYRRLQDELEELYHSHVRLDGTDTEIAALTLAIDRICELSSGIYEKSGGQLNRRASEILSELTGGAYNRMILDETAEVRIHTPSRVLGLHQVSGGTLQQIYFALRMAAGELLSNGLALPLVLDETFAMYDDVRLEAALRWLKKSGRQVILFTCQRREKEILERIQ